MPAPVVVIHFDADTARIPIDRLARDCGVDVPSAENALEMLLQRGFLTRRQDGSFDAVIPGKGRTRG